MDAAPLVGIAAAPVPSGGRAFWLKGRDGARLRAALFPAMTPVVGGVVLSPGRTEPIEKYFETIGELQARGFTVLAHDWRGQGLSQRALPDRLRGHAQGFEAYLSDYSLMLDEAGAKLPHPWVSLAHSMGGGLVLLALSRGERRLDGVMSTAPMIGLAAVSVLPGAAGLIARAAAVLGLGGVQLQRYDPFALTFERNRLTHDRTRFERYMAQLRACPDLALGGPTWGWLDYALRAGAVLSRPGIAAAIATPLTLIGAGEDALVLSAAAQAFARAAPNGRYVEAPGAFHEILMETDRVRALFWREFDALIGRLG
ncbi:MAG TPA: alpha/beta hydrolase [Caulobacteraceae bacterium]|nr:alpha/beta hydrolase [Caulobacteraceae bacterium]